MGRCNSSPVLMDRLSSQSKPQATAVDEPRAHLCDQEADSSRSRNRLRYLFTKYAVSRHEPGLHTAPAFVNHS